MVRVFSTLGCPEATLGEALALAGRHGLDGLEVRTLGGTTDLPAYFRREFGSPQALADRLGGGSVRLVALGTSLRVIDAMAADRAAFLEYVPWAEALGIRWLRVFDGGRRGDAAEMDRAAETLRWWRGLRAERGWRADIMVETHDALATASARQRFLAAVPDADLLWDAHHTWRRGGEDPRATWPSIRARVRHIHVKDSVSAPGTARGFAYVLPGAGEFPMARLLAALGAGFAGPVSLEWERHWHPSLPDLDLALSQAAARRWW